MATYKLLIYPAAQQDLTDMVEYINLLAPEAAIKLYDAIIERISLLSRLPASCPLLRNTELRAKGYRALLVENYIVFYVIKGKTVQVRRILYNRRDYQYLL
jgi:addiction module RelE/StbE family toxin